MEPHREPEARPGTGDRHAGDGAPPGPGVAPPAEPGGGRPPLEELLAAAMRGRADDTAARTRAVAAFRAARDGGAHTARTRRRDDWRPKERRRPSRSLRAALAVLLAGLTLGGVAVAAIGPVSRDDTGHRDRVAVRPSDGVPDRSPGSPPPTRPGSPPPTRPGSPAAPAVRPPRDRDTEAHCRAYASVRDRGGALDSRAWRRLVTAAGGEDEVEAFCARRLAASTATKDTKDAKDAKGAKGAKGAERSGNAKDAEKAAKSGSGR
ncbi:hypothetical protein [Streptomyces triticiradicis]|uniref:Uncharacterized protein n=1 Tax=Streptomyces triticiradicis TaxID=2651189 RepID=A0A7J5DIV8_9ACTN|nr:hypothetical protein [Streptomyces triticiradicis]KAB1988627.1 hypothetical protein F8144_11140 [Streptomyces triticiradicis]